MKYAVIYEKTATGYSAYVPDLPGCVAVGKTREEAVKLIHEAIEAHLELLREEGEPVPEARSTAVRECSRSRVRRVRSPTP